LTDLIGTLLIGFFSALLVVLAWWLLISTEGVYLGRRVVIWLYDLYAQRYDDIKNYHPDFEQWLLANPILGAIEPHQSPLVLDVATGTGRLPLALLNHPDFHGRFIALDLSRRMLHLAARKLHGYQDRVSLLWSPAEKLPFADGTFDVVTCLEALEFMTSPKTVLQELIRVLRPDGLLLVSNRVNTRLMPGKTWSDDEVHQMLSEFGMEMVEIEPWQMDYHRVWGLKAGNSQPIGSRPLAEVLRCPRCMDRLMVQQGQLWICEGCSGQARIALDGVIELSPLYP
jgi:ubiquinone/menaquinone biosynthesis C-methylase UbiE